MPELIYLLGESTLETLIMIGIAAPMAAVAGLGLGMGLVITPPGTVAQKTLSAITNLGRSIPFIILIVAIVPLTRLVVGTSIGTRAAIVPLIVGAVPYAARLAEAALLEVDPGIIEAVQVMGATRTQLLTKAYLPEALPALVRALTVMIVTLVSYSAMAGAIGGGGLGDLAIRYGYQRFRPDVMISTVVVIVCLVQTLQWFGDHLARRLDRR